MADTPAPSQVCQARWGRLANARRGDRAASAAARAVVALPLAALSLAALSLAALSASAALVGCGGGQAPTPPEGALDANAQDATPSPTAPTTDGGSDLDEATPPAVPAAVAAREALTARCEGSNDASACAALASMMIHGQGGPRAYVQARAFAERACKANVPDACADLGHLLIRGYGGKLDQPRAVQLLRRACDGASARGCALLGNMTLQGVSTPRDPTKARDLLTRACDMGYPDACHTLANLHTTGDDAPYDLAAAIGLLTRACDMSLAPACAALADAQRRGLGVPKDPAAADATLSSACDRGLAPACLTLAFAALDGPSPTSALPLFDRACAPPDTLDGCRALALLHIEGRHVPRDPNKGLALLERACDLHDPAACQRLSLLYAQSKLIPRDLPRALDRLTRACDLNPYFCDDLANAYDGSFTPLLTSLNYERAAQLRERACDGHPARCASAAWAFATGAHAPANISRATDLFARACDADPTHCQAYASLYTSWQYVSFDLPRALPLFERACAAASPASCTQSAELYELGEHAGIPADLPKSLTLLERACRLGDARGCLQLMRRDPESPTLQRCAGGDLSACDHLAAAYKALSTDITQHWPSEPSPTPLQALFDRAEETLRKPCEDLGHGPSCVLLGKRLLGSTPFDALPTPDARWDAAADAFQRGCDARTPEACTELTSLWSLRNDGKASKDRAADAAQQACALDTLDGCLERLRLGHLDGMRPCEAGQRTACARLVGFLSINLSPHIDVPSAAATRYAALTRTCDLGYGVACRTLSSIHAGAEGPPPNSDHDPRHFLERACAAGDELSCSQVDLEYEISVASGKHIDRAITFYEGACAKGRASACRKLADLHRAGAHITRDPTKMRALYEQGCEAGDAQACALLGQLLLAGDVIPADPARAQDIFLKSCQRDNHRDACLLYVKSDDLRLESACLSGDLSACTALETGYLFALMEADGERLRPRFIDFYRKRCDAQQPAGCRGLGNIYRDATGVPQDLPRARALHERACVLEHTATTPPTHLNTCYGLETLCGFFYADSTACAILGGWYDAGIVLTQDSGRAAEMLRQACSLGWTSSRCFSVAGP